MFKRTPSGGFRFLKDEALTIGLYAGAISPRIHGRSARGALLLRPHVLLPMPEVQ